MAESHGNEVEPTDQIIVSRDSGRGRAALALCVMDRQRQSEIYVATVEAQDNLIGTLSDNEPRTNASGGVQASFLQFCRRYRFSPTGTKRLHKEASDLVDVTAEFPWQHYAERI